MEKKRRQIPLIERWENMNMICPICEQGGILKVKNKKNGEILYICEECDSIWTKEISDEYISTFENYSKSNNITNSWSEIEIIGSI